MPRKSDKTLLEVDGRVVEISNLDKVMYPGNGFTKAHVIDYYTRVAAFLLPHIKDRPLTLKRFPDGVTGEFFYEKDAPSFTPAWIKTFPIRRRSGESHIRYILINDLPALVWSASMANLEIHPFLARAPNIDSPTMIVFDLDPGEGASILHSAKVSLLLRDFLQQFDLQSFPKVSGSKGIHVHIPLNQPTTYEVTQSFAKAVAQWLERKHPDFVVSEMPKARRRKKVFVDWSQNAEHKSTVSVYSLRAKRETPFVAMPLRWEELDQAVKKASPSLLYFAPEPALERLNHLGDLFTPLLEVKQNLPEPFVTELQSQPADVKPKGEDSLQAYRAKRDFTKTPEPPPVPRPKRTQSGRRLFVIQKHAASRLHYDLRLEMHGALKSWAVPKGVPYERGERRLAMHVEDHPMEYVNFEGVIPEGEYGAGSVMVWDTGTYEVIEGNYYKGTVRLFFDGKKIKGEWQLERDYNDKNRKRWFLIKTGATMRRLSSRKETTSTLSGLSLEEIAEARSSIWHSNRGARPERMHTKESQIPFDSLPELKKDFIEPMYAKPVHKLPETEDWSYEVKLDGYRCLGSKTKKGFVLFSRRGNRLNQRFSHVAAALKELEPGTIVDGEVVAFDEEGKPSFQVLQHGDKGAPSYFYAFDLLAYRGKSLLGLPLETRREFLRRAISGLPNPIRISESWRAGPEFVAAAKELELEGIVAKRRESSYEPGKRSGAWVKYKLSAGQEFVIGGYIPGGYRFDSLLVGYYKNEKLLFTAKIRNGFVPRIKDEIAKKLKRLETDTCPFANLPEKKGARRGEALTKEFLKKCRWVEPYLVAQVEFSERTSADHLRHSRFVALREDKNPREIVKEGP